MLLPSWKGYQWLKLSFNFMHKFDEQSFLVQCCLKGERVINDQRWNLILCFNLMNNHLWAQCFLKGESKIIKGYQLRNLILCVNLMNNHPLVQHWLRGESKVIKGYQRRDLILCVNLMNSHPLVQRWLRGERETPAAVCIEMVSWFPNGKDKSREEWEKNWVPTRVYVCL